MSKIIRGSSSSDFDFHYGNSMDDPSKTAWHSTWNYIYNSEKKTCCARTPKQWIIMGSYYMLYTTFIVSLFGGFLYGCYYGIKMFSEDVPLVEKSSLLEDAFPGLGVIPSIVDSKYPIIWYSADPEEQMTERYYIDELDQFFAKYKNADPEKYASCESGNNGTESGKNAMETKNGKQSCYFDWKSLGDCIEKGYHYTNSSLCFFIKLNRLPNWTPVYYANEKELPPDTRIQNIKDIIRHSRENKIYVQCFGRNFWDKEYLGNITYFPQDSFNGNYFPYNGEPDYLQPIVGLKLDNFTTGVVIHIGCRLWLKNIKDNLNHIHLKIFVDSTLSS